MVVNKMIRICITWGFSLCLIFSWISSVQAQRNMAIVIGVSDYDDRSGFLTLDFVYNDASVMAEILKSAKFNVKSVYARNENEQGNLLPTKVNIEQTLEKALSSEECASDDTVLVYFSGHGTISEKDKQKTLLIVKDSVLGDEKTYLEAQAVRQMLKNCPAKKTLFLIDSCHAGGTRSALKQTADRLVVGGVDGILTFASCTMDQTSKQWSSKSMSFFTYWLAEGLKGYADNDRNRTISTEELFNYIHHNLKLTENVHNHGQWPVIVATPETEHFDLTKSRTRDIYKTLDDFASQLVTQTEILRLDRLVLTDFKLDGSQWSSPEEQNHVKSLSDFCTNELKRRIVEKSAGRKLTVVSKSATEDHQGAHVKSQLVRQEREQKNGRDIYTLSTDLYIPDQKESACSIEANVYANRTGESNQVTSDSNSTAANTPASPGEENRITYAGEADLPAVSILVRGEDGLFHQRMPIRIDDADWLPLEENEVYKIALQSPAPSSGNMTPVYGVRVLVDGYNTLPQYQSYVAAKFVIREAQEDPLPQSDSANRQDPPNSAADSESASERVSSDSPVALPTATPQSTDDSSSPHIRPFVRLDEARFWILQGHNYWEINGFYHDIGANAAYDEFTVTRSANALNQEGQYTDQMGLITIAFYELTKTRGPVSDLMTRPGKTSPHPIFVMEGYEIGAMLKCVQFRYASPYALQNYQSEEQR